MTFVALVMFALSAVLDHAGVFHYAGDDWRNFDRRTVYVTHVADGDTISVRPVSGGPETRVRLLGIDAPELHSRDDPSHADFWAWEARRYTEARAAGKPVTLRLE